MSKSLFYMACVLGLTGAFPASLRSQELRTVVGSVLSAVDSTSLGGVRVIVLGLPGQTESDAQGRFVLRNLPREALRVAFERIGVAADTVLLPAEEIALSVYLRLTPVELEPFRGTPALAARQRFEAVAQTSIVTLDAIEIARMPALAEPDLARAVQLLPGTVAKNDYSVGFNVRGGEADQNLILLDGVPVFNPSHLGGLFSTFDNSAVSQVDFLTGGFPAGFGGRLSSVLDVKLRTGNPRSTDVHGGLSFLSGKLLVEGPILGSGVTYMVGARRTYADVLLAPFDPDLVPYYFGDALAKVTVPLPAGGTISVTSYWGRDVLDLPWVDPEPGRDGIDLEFDWGNRLVGLTLRQPLGAMELEQHLSASAFSTGLGLEPDILRLDNSARVLSARTSLAISPRRVHDVRVGVGVEDYAMDFNLESTALETNVFELAYRPTVWSAFIDDQWHVAGWLLLRPGVRVERVTGGADFTGVSPRIGLKAFVNDDLALTGSAGRFYQPIHSIRDQELPVTLFDFWIGADDVTPIARSDHLVLGFEQWFGQSLSLTVEGYTKSFDNLVFQNLEDDPKVRGDEFVPASGYARGVDILLRKYDGRVTGWIAYGFTKTVRRSEGQSFPPAHDRRHTLNIVVQAPGPLGSMMGARWGYGSPLPYTGIVGQWLHREYNAELHAFDFFEDEAISTIINGERFPYYARLDLAFRWQFEKWGATWRPYLQLVNAYNRTNVWVYTFDFDRSPPTRTGFSQLPIFPTFGVEFEW